LDAVAVATVQEGWARGHHRRPAADISIAIEWPSGSRAPENTFERAGACSVQAELPQAQEALVETAQGLEMPHHEEPGGTDAWAIQISR
jgi:hypothetical protein